MGLWVQEVTVPTPLARVCLDTWVKNDGKSKGFWAHALMSASTYIPIARVRFGRWGKLGTF